MTRNRNYQLSARMGATLALLALTILAAALVTGVVVTILLLLLYAVTLAADYGMPSQDVLLAVLGCSAVCVLAFVAWGERHAPDHTVAAIGAAPADEADSPALLSTVRSLSQQADTPVPSVFVAPTETPLSLTTGFRPRNARLVVSEGLLDALSPSELEAVLAHELAHVKNRDTSVMTLATLPIGAADRVMSLLTGRTHGVEHGQPSRASYADALVTAGLLFVPPLWLCGHLLWASLSRTREFTADSGAVAITGEPTALVSALETLDEDLSTRPATDFRQVEIAALSVVEADRTNPVGVFPPLGRPLTNVFATHPATTTRIERLRSVEREQGRRAGDR